MRARKGLNILSTVLTDDLSNQFADSKTPLSTHIAFRKGIREGSAWGNWSGG